MLIDLFEDLLRLDGAIRTNGLESHRHVVLSNGLSSRSTKVDGQLLRIVLDNVGDRKA